MSDSPSTSDSPPSSEPSAAAATIPEPTPPNPKVQSAISSLSSIISVTVPPSLPLLLTDSAVSSAVSDLLRRPDSGSGDHLLCRWLYDTFHSSDPSLQLLVLRFVPTIAGLYLSRVSLRRPQAGFEAILLALYAHETTARGGQPVTVNIPDMSSPSLYNECREPSKNNSTSLNMAVVSPTLDPHGTVRSTRRARIVGVALELYYSRICEIPRESKLDFCEFCEKWASQNVGNTYLAHPSEILDSDDDNSANRLTKDGRIPLPWELLQPVLRILGHCLFRGGSQILDEGLFTAATAACTSLYARALHDINPKAILATGSLLKLSEMALDPKNQFDYTEIKNDAVITVGD